MSTALATRPAFLELARSDVVVAARAEDAKAPRRFSMLAYTGAVFAQSWAGAVILDLKGLEVAADGSPAFRDHDPSRWVGRIDELENDGAKLGAKGFLFAGIADADEVQRISDQGGRWQASIRASIDWDAVDEIGAASSVVVNGRTFTGPAIVLRKTKLVECSFVPLGADSDTAAVALAAAAANKEKTMAGPTTETTNAIETERQRAKDIRAAFPDAAFALEAIENGWSLIEAKAKRADKLEKDIAAAQVSAAAELAAEKKKNADLEARLKLPSPASLLGGAPASTASNASGDDPVACFEAAVGAEVAALTAAGAKPQAAQLGLVAMTPEAAMRRKATHNVMARDPQLVAAYREELAKRGVGVRPHSPGR